MSCDSSQSAGNEPLLTCSNNDRVSSSEETIDGKRYNVLVEFAHRHLDFHRAELECVLLMHGILLGKHCTEIPLPSPPIIGTAANYPRSFVILSFSRNAVGTLFRVDDDGEDSEIPGLATVLSRCTLLKSVVELWGCGSTLSSCISSVHACTAHTAFGRDLLLTTGTSPLPQEAPSWKITVATLGSKQSREQQNAMRASLSFLNFQGTVSMDNPTREFVLLSEGQLDTMGTPTSVQLGVYFGRYLQRQNGCKNHWRYHLHSQYTLPHRKYLGPTSMDAELSFLMTNLALVTKHSFCMDPFVGTGSILLSCAIHGAAYCMGTDIDLKVLKGHGPNNNVMANFRQFGLNRPELIRSDNSLYGRHYRITPPMVDAIVCDPPYGIRAGARKTGSSPNHPFHVVPENFRHSHIAQTQHYSMEDVMKDLLTMAAQTLRLGGRLVYIIPTTLSKRELNVETHLPKHECLTIKHVCFQPMQLQLGRCMVCMEKTIPYDASKQDWYGQNIWSTETAANEMLEKKTNMDLKRKPGYEQKAAYRKEKRRAARKAKRMIQQGFL